MDNPLDDALGHEPEVEDTHVETPAEPEPPAAPDGPARGPDGKFAAKGAEAETPPATPAAPEPGHVPISAMLDEREKRQGLEKQLADLRAREARAAAGEPPTPEAQFQAALYAQNLRTSRKFADRQYGPELTKTVHQWAVARCDADPMFNEQMRASDDPYEAAMQAYNREQILSAVGPGDLDAFRAWQAAQAELAGQSPAPPPAAPTPPRSLATAPGTGLAGKAASEVGEGTAFSAAFS